MRWLRSDRHRRSTRNGPLSALPSVARSDAWKIRYGSLDFKEFDFEEEIDFGAGAGTRPLHAGAWSGRHHPNEDWDYPHPECDLFHQGWAKGAERPAD